MNSLVTVLNIHNISNKTSCWEDLTAKTSKPCALGLRDYFPYWHQGRWVHLKEQRFVQAGSGSVGLRVRDVTSMGSR